MQTLIHSQELLIENLRRIQTSYPHVGTNLGGRAGKARHSAMQRFLSNARQCGLTVEQASAALNDAVDMYKLEEVS